MKERLAPPRKNTGYALDSSSPRSALDAPADLLNAGSPERRIPGSPRSTRTKVFILESLPLQGQRSSEANWESQFVTAWSGPTTRQR